jgi:hypothetical protein
MKKFKEVNSLNKQIILRLIQAGTMQKITWKGKKSRKVEA